MRAPGIQVNESDRLRTQTKGSRRALTTFHDITQLRAAAARVAHQERLATTGTLADVGSDQQADDGTGQPPSRGRILLLDDDVSVLSTMRRIGSHSPVSRPDS
jgi:hypothetical protein